MSVSFEFVIGGPAVSQQTRRPPRREMWKEEVRSAARDRWTADSPVAGSVAVTITYFFESGEPDVDNIPKPILDAMKGLVYSDGEPDQKRTEKEEQGLNVHSFVLLAMASLRGDGVVPASELYDRRC